VRFHVALIGALFAFALAACAIQRAQMANDAQQSMIGLSKEQVLACMGPPANQATVGQTEVWSYNSGNGQTDAAVFGGRFTASAVETRRFCTVNVAMTSGRVTAVNYTGPTGGLLTAGEQCAYAVSNCAH
jgi:outer membrane protein assembly factor BamE (lipoprotein component of BamABCDE complex)